MSAWVLGELRPREAASDIAAVLLESGEHDTQLGRNCAEALGKLRVVEAVPALAAAAASPAISVRFFAIWALGRIDPNAALGVLLAAKDDPSPEVREQAVRALAKSSDERAVTRLITHCEAPYARVTVRGLIKAADKRAVPTLVEVLRTTDDRQTRKLAGRALAAIGRPANAAFFLLHHQDPRVRRAAAWVIGQVADEHLVGGLAMHLLHLTDRDELVRARIAGARFP